MWLRKCQLFTYKVVNMWNWGALVQPTILIIYDRLCSLLHTTDLLKNGCLACIGSSYDKNTKMGAFVSLLEHHCLWYIYICYVNQILVRQVLSPTLCMCSSLCHCFWFHASMDKWIIKRMVYQTRLSRDECVSGRARGRGSKSKGWRIKTEGWYAM